MSRGYLTPVLFYFVVHSHTDILIGTKVKAIHVAVKFVLIVARGEGAIDRPIHNCFVIFFIHSYVVTTVFLNILKDRIGIG
ncbi:hypothetical protein SAMN04488691_102207 [Haloferax larsenii]|uniref:Uncharacterized protein n=1 Tax=Haloferax larsenii TaxID=302484 RepID=A0A1H7L4V9_HALLR|nr:hypothetical protein SAMN04488691_102207 [Haloferax larsenii]